MKLIRFRHDGRAAAGVLGARSSMVLDLTAALDIGTVEDLLRGDGLVERARELAAAEPETGESGGAGWIPADRVEILRPILAPSKIVCVGLNYRDHCTEQNIELPKHPTIFAKFPNVLLDPGAPIRVPATSDKVDYEAELAFVIGRRAKRVSAAAAPAHIAGYMCMNDVSERTVQKGEGQWVRGKSFDTFGPCGPWLVTPDEVGDPCALAIRLVLNGEVMQSSNTRELVFDPFRLVEFISSGMTLEPGDIVTTGTPHGVGLFRSPQVFLRPGDTVTVEIEKLGALTNPVVAD